MADNVIILPVITTLDVPVERVLNAAIKADLDSAIVIGYDRDGEEYFASSISDRADVLWLLQRACIKLLKISDDVI